MDQLFGGARQVFAFKSHRPISSWKLKHKLMLPKHVEVCPDPLQLLHYNDDESFEACMGSQKQDATTYPLDHGQQWCPQSHAIDVFVQWICDRCKIPIHDGRLCALRTHDFRFLQSDVYGIFDVLANAVTVSNRTGKNKLVENSTAPIMLKVDASDTRNLPSFKSTTLKLTLKQLMLSHLHFYVSIEADGIFFEKDVQLYSVAEWEALADAGLWTLASQMMVLHFAKRCLVPSLTHHHL
jgi:hypothetical protein